MQDGLWIIDSLWIGFGFNILEQNVYGMDLELKLSPSGTSAYDKFKSVKFGFSIFDTFS